jgi:hypothetical protein
MLQTRKQNNTFPWFTSATVPASTGLPGQSLIFLITFPDVYYQTNADNVLNLVCHVFTSPLIMRCRDVFQFLKEQDNTGMPAR